MQALKSVFKGLNAIHYLSIASMLTALVLACLSMGGAWIRATDGPCEAYFYGRSLVEENCIGFVTGQYYKCEASFCSPCQEAGKAMLCLGVFGLISGMLTILVIVKRILKDLPQDWAGRNLKKLSIGISLFTAVLWFLAWLVFLGACESNLGIAFWIIYFVFVMLKWTQRKGYNVKWIGDFGSSTPHTGFVLMFLAMVVNFLCDSRVST